MCIKINFFCFFVLLIFYLLFEIKKNLDKNIYTPVHARSNKLIHIHFTNQNLHITDMISSACRDLRSILPWQLFWDFMCLGQESIAAEAFKLWESMEQANQSSDIVIAHFHLFLGQGIRLLQVFIVVSQ